MLVQPALCIRKSMAELIKTENKTKAKVEYATFLSRSGAYFLDTVIVAGVALFVNAINIANFKSFLIYLPVAILSIFYKPFMESHYGATIGKMAFQLKVTDQNFKRIDFKQSILRSIILIFPAILLFPFIMWLLIIQILRNFLKLQNLLRV